MFNHLISKARGQTVEVWFRSIDTTSHISVASRSGEWETSIRFLDEDPPIVILSGDHRDSLSTLTKAEVRTWIRDNAHKHPSKFDQILERIYATTP